MTISSAASPSAHGQSVRSLPRYRASWTVGARRITTAWVFAAIGLPGLVMVLLPFRSEHALPAVLLVFVLFTVAVAMLGGMAPAIATAVSSFVLMNYFLTPPYHSFVVGTVANLLGLVTFLVVGSVISFLVGQVGRRSVEARQAQTSAESLAEVDRLRTALLRAVSHDLRSPLSSVKASVTSLLQDEVDWSDADRQDFLRVIEQESNRLDHLIANLLDLGRLEAGAVDASSRAVSFEEVIPAALWTLGHETDVVDLRVDETAPPVLGDPRLLERAVANVISNAVSWTPAEKSVEVEALALQDEVELRVIDHGPGVPESQRRDIFEPFYRRGDHGDGTGAGLGLAVARGFVESMGGRIHAEETPGGGLTMVLTLPAAPR